MNLRRSGTSRNRYILWATYGLAVVGTAAVGLLAGLMFGYAVEMPGVEQLQQSRPDIISYVYSDDGRILGQFAHEKRILVTYEQIPEIVRQAVVSVEDANFFKHTGIDFRRFLVAVVRDIVLGERKGASTLTMQLSKMQFTSTEKTIRRKILDMLYAIEAEVYPAVGPRRHIESDPPFMVFPSKWRGRC